MIKDIVLRAVFDSRGMQTVEAIITDGKNYAKASAPSGTSRSRYEAVAFPNNSVELGINRFYKKKNKLIGADELDQQGIDSLLHEIDGTENFSYIGANIATAISIANARLASLKQGLELYKLVSNLARRKPRMPRLLGNAFGGGAHGKGMSIQEILISSKSKMIREEEKRHVKIYNELGSHLAKNCLASGKTIENAWTSKLNSLESIKLISKIARGFEKDIELGVDMAASEYFNKGYYLFDKNRLSKNGYFDFVKEIISTNKIYYVEDPFESSDFASFSQLRSELGKDFLVVGDDLYATNKERIKEGKKQRSTNGVIIKINQVGTLSDTIDAVKVAQGLKTIVSHRSGETEDNFLAHLAVGLGADYIKCGIVGGERVAKINELMRIERFIINDKKY